MYKLILAIQQGKSYLYYINRLLSGGGMKLLVTGGNGFIGQEICKTAVRHGFEVISVSRRGYPDNKESWMSQVNWVSANIFNIDRWTGYLSGMDGVIHTIGILRERPEHNITYERLNGDSVIIAASAAITAHVPVFVMISASDAPPLLKRYIRAKRDAESFLLEQKTRSVIMRPGLVYGQGRKGSKLIASLTRLGSQIPLIGTYYTKYSPVHVTVLAKAVINSVMHEEIQGLIDIGQIEKLGMSIPIEEGLR
ncbi:MAG TPA: NAD-dependent epimerase/dehydratase family protein [Candidatus Marinimicrobia bacterium]|nr:NAD-dependent epimerase/dehydratase family protein [Candidatus Neomarinimicrobiota bacterium]